VASSRDQSRLGDIERELTRFVRRLRATSTSMAADVHPEVELLTAVALLMRTVRTFSHLRSQQLGPPGATLGVLTGAAGTAAPEEHAFPAEPPQAVARLRRGADRALS